MTTTTKQLITAENLIRATGPFAIAAGLVFAGIQPIHPPDYLPSVTTGTWAAFMYAKLAMCLFFLVGITGIYSRQVTRAGWLGSDPTEADRFLGPSHIPTAPTGTSGRGGRVSGRPHPSPAKTTW